MRTKQWNDREVRFEWFLLWVHLITKKIKERKDIIVQLLNKIHIYHRTVLVNDDLTELLLLFLLIYFLKLKPEQSCWQTYFVYYSSFPFLCRKTDMYCLNINSFILKPQGLNVWLNFFTLTERGVSLVQPTSNQSGLYVAQDVKCLA